MKSMVDLIGGLLILAFGFIGLAVIFINNALKWRDAAQKAKAELKNTRTKNAAKSVENLRLSLLVDALKEENESRRKVIERQQRLLKVRKAV